MPGTEYFYRVFARNAGGDSVPSNEDSATTSGVLVAPDAPTALTATTFDDDRIDLAWTDNSNKVGGAGGTSTVTALSSFDGALSPIAFRANTR